MSAFRKLTAGLAGLAACAVAVPATAADDTQFDGTITLGAAISLTGKYSTNGGHTKKGYDMAVDRINSMGGVEVGDKTYKLEVKYYDDESTPARGAQLAERLIQQDDVKFVLGPYSSGMTKAIAPVTEEHGVPMVEANGASRSLFTQGYDYLFAVLSTSEQYLASAVDLRAELARKDGMKPSNMTIAGVFENDPFSQDIRAGVLADAKEYGMEMVVDDKLPPEINDMSSTLIKVKATKPDMLVVSGHSKGAALAIRQMSEMRVNVPMLAMTHCDSAQIIKKFGDKAEYTLCASQWAPSLKYADKYFGEASQFAKDFKKRYGYAPPYQSAESAAAVLVYKNAFERADSLNKKAVRDALQKTDMMTFYGPINFDDTGKNIAKPMVLYQVQDGEYKVVAPTKYANADVRYPMPKWSER
ncbi:amino acid ABC transporter substrate-binding protein [Rhodovibrio sodomensis]|uniref:Amino acid ABC transporter substrate-binding protein n=1 Tax=Rhodovibrio sodomensis TaxID=1088 RepID=A0ABS1DC85_9PROT|nr:amino acid ABC transporter substrate-binding protein [Rhodovibrio sodomensis]MBK1668083.1 amino acid ABC transporter substrate-binding protein [Rhodovibrio sodomensis]